MDRASSSSMKTALLIALLVATRAFAQDYPNRAVTIIVPYAPGGAADIIARPLALGLERELRQPFLVVNRPGASGAIGAAQTASAAPDGYTLLAAVVQVSILPDVDILFGRVPSYRREQLTGIARLTAEPVVFMAGAQTPWRSIQAVIDDARRQPGKITYSTGGAYSGSHLPFAILTQAVNVDMTAIPYKGGGPSMLAVLTGEVAMTSQTPGVAYGYVNSGKIRALAHSGRDPLRNMPDVPSLKSLGYDAEFYLWAGFFAPRGIPEDVARKLGLATDHVMRSDAMKQASAGIKTDLAYIGIEDFNKWWDADTRCLVETVRRIGKVE